VGAAGHVYALDAQTEPWPVETEAGGAGGASSVWWIAAVFVGALAGVAAYLWYHHRWPFSAPSGE
ncbi:MAG: hypothetical protein KGY55_02785, partial [Candidatus Thermoplasmatota archaeon]|nr:hypothetical protein [Candidatus Thermoplasmatota archaeon]